MGLPACCPSKGRRPQAGLDRLARPDQPQHEADRRADYWRASGPPLPNLRHAHKEDIQLPYDESWVLLHDLYALKESRLGEYVGELEAAKMVEVERCLRYTFDIETTADREARKLS